MLANLRIALLTSMVGVTAALALIPASAEAKSRAARTREASTYVLEFRSRPTNWAGHSHVVARKVDPRGRTTVHKVAGFWPDPTIPRIMVPFGSRGVVEAGREDSVPPTKTHAVRVDRATFEKAVAKMDRIERQRPTFDPFTQNCNTFVAVVARTAGVKAPSDYFQLPDAYIGQMQAMNGSKGQRRHKLARV